MLKNNFDQWLTYGTLEEVLEGAGYTICEDIYLSLIGRFACIDNDAKKFLSDSILNYLLDTGITFDGNEYRQTLGNIMATEYIIVYEPSTYIYYLLHREDYEEDVDCEEYKLSEEDYAAIIKEIKYQVKKDFESNKKK